MQQLSLKNYREELMPFHFGYNICASLVFPVWRNERNMINLGIAPGINVIDPRKYHLLLFNTDTSVNDTEVINNIKKANSLQNIGITLNPSINYIHCFKKNIIKKERFKTLVGFRCSYLYRYTTLNMSEEKKYLNAGLSRYDSYKYYLIVC